MLSLPEDFKASSVRLNFDSSDIGGNLIEKGLTASGNVEDFHPIPILAPSPFRHVLTYGGEPNASAKVRLSEDNTK